MMAQAQFFYKDATAPRPNRPNHIGTCILIVCEKKLLLEHRTDSDMWALIGGGLKLDERLADGVIRETNIAATHIPIIEDYLISEFGQKPADGMYQLITEPILNKHYV